MRNTQPQNRYQGMDGMEVLAVPWVVYAGECSSEESNELERREGENMCLIGIELEGLYACFPKFDQENIGQVYNEVKNKPEDAMEYNMISMNCSWEGDRLW